jgi:aspartyl-tRNA(Asn)/glutamyl-tRNA(Gln) amidotransferase subunit C
MTEDLNAIKRLETLARIELTPEERERLSPQLDAILEYVRRLQGVDTSGVEAKAAVKPVPAEALRADEPADGLSREAALGGAPDARNGLFRVPAIIKR